jgi:hypothetical protein
MFMVRFVAAAMNCFDYDLVHCDSVLSGRGGGGNDHDGFVFTLKMADSGYFRNHLKLNSVALVRKMNIPTERPPLVAKLVPTFVDRACSVVSATDPMTVNLGFLDPEPIFFPFK